MDTVSARVAVLGSDTFLGKHASWLARERGFEDVILIEMQDTSDSQRLRQLLKGAEVIIHAARIHPKDVVPGRDAYTENLRLSTVLVEALESVSACPTILFASSIHARGETPYGRAKRDATRLLEEWAARSGGVAISFLIPHEFGEEGIAGKDSVVATFCDALARGTEPEVVPGARVSLVHIREVVARLLDHAGSQESGEITVPGTDMLVSDLLQILERFHERYCAGLIPEFASALELALFNTLRWHLFRNGFYPRSIPLHTDARGALFEVVKGNAHGQVFVSFSEPGVTRGQHYHTRKIERFCVITGQAEISLRALGGKEVHAFAVTGDEPVYIDMPTFFTHKIRNTGTQRLTTLFWASEVYDATDSDTYQEEV